MGAGEQRGLGGVCANHPTNPASAICQRCGDFICGYCLRPSPTGEAYCPNCHSDTGGDYGELAWENTDDFGGIVPAFFRTLKTSLLEPNTFFKSVDPDGGYRAPLIYLFICFGTSVLGSLVSTAAQFFVTPGPNPGKEILEREPDLAIAVAVAVVVLLPLWGIIYQLLRIGYWHGSCWVVGAAGSGFRATFRLICYSSGPNILAGIASTLVGVLGAWHPILYAIVSMVASLLGLALFFYELVLIVIGIRDLHDASIGRAIAAAGVALGAWLLLGCGLMSLSFLLLYAGW